MLNLLSVMWPWLAHIKFWNFLCLSVRPYGEWLMLQANFTPVPIEFPHLYSYVQVKSISLSNWIKIWSILPPIAFTRETLYIFFQVNRSVCKSEDLKWIHSSKSTTVCVYHGLQITFTRILYRMDLVACDAWIDKE